jgi:hypothetical protein
MNTSYAYSLFYLNVHGNKSFNVVERRKSWKLRSTAYLRPQTWLLFVHGIDLSATRYKSCQQTALFVLATPDAYHKHDVSFNIKGSRYPLILANDLGGYHANYNTPFAVPYMSNFYCTAIHRLQTHYIPLCELIKFERPYSNILVKSPLD